MSPKENPEPESELVTTETYVTKFTKDVEIVSEPSPSFWRDVTPYFHSLWLLLMTHVLFQVTGNMLLGAWIMYVGTPLYNAVRLDDSRNLDKKVEKAYIRASWMFFIPLQVYNLANLAAHIFALCIFSTKYKPDHWLFEHTIENNTQYVAYGLSCSFFAALAQVSGHELLHDKHWWNKVIGTLPYSQFFYTHFMVEHTRGHHKAICTPEDPVSHPLGMTSYEAMARAYVGCTTKSWDRESQRLQKLHGNVSMVHHLLENQMVHYTLLHVGMVSTIYSIFGLGGLKFQAMFTVLSTMFLELINYLEHYGLSRTKDHNGVYESIGAMHSWNSTSSHVGFRLQRHSDHHAHSFRPFQVLRRFDRAPYLPHEYVPMLFMAICPPVFHYVMDPRVQSVIDAKAGKVNPNQWNNEMPMTLDDKHRKNVGYAYFGVCTLIFTALLFA